MVNPTNTNFFTELNGSSSSFSGLSSGINSKEIISALVQARRQPAVQLENRISENDAQVAAYDELGSLMTNLRSPLEALRGEVGFFAESVFDQKVAGTSSKASDTAPVDYQPVSADEVLGVSVANNAQVGKYEVEVLQLAQNHQLRSDAIANRSASLDSLGIPTGTITVNGKDIVVDADDSLLDVRDKLNAADADLSATILSASDTEHFLVVNGDKTGTSNAVTFGGDAAVLQGLGLTDAGGAVKNELQAVQDATIRVNGLGVDIVRETNSIDDVIDGVTLDLFGAEEGTEVVIEVANDLQSVKDELVNFVEAFNELKSFIEDQRQEKVRGDSDSPEFGPLAFDSTLRTLNGDINRLVSQTVGGQADGFESLGQVGITMNDDFKLEIDDSVLDNRLITNVEEVRNLFEFSSSSSDSRIRVTNPGTTAVPNTDGAGNEIPYYVNIGGTDADGNITSANIQYGPGAGAGGVDDGSVEISGRSIKVLEGPAKGLTFTFSGDPNSGPVEDIELNINRGVADAMFYSNEKYVSKNGTGSVIENAQNLSSQNQNYLDRIGDIDARVEIYRQRLVRQFAQMEQAVAQANSLKESITSSFEAQNKD